MKDCGGHQLASAIIGKPLADQSDQCYIRIAGKDPVYIVKLDTGKLSVRFDGLDRAQSAEPEHDGPEEDRNQGLQR